MEHCAAPFVEEGKAAAHHAPAALHGSTRFQRSLFMKIITALLLSTALAAPLAGLAATAHDHGSAAPQQLQLNAGKKWDTDAPLRQAMSAVRQSVAQTLPAAHAGKATPADYDAFGQAIHQQVAYMVENCKLPAAADEQLHIVVAELMAGAEAAQGQHGEGQRAAGVVRVAKAANAYGKHFSHQGWKALELPH